MFKTAMLNLMYNVGIFGSVLVGYLACEQKKFLADIPGDIRAGVFCDAEN